MYSYDRRMAAPTHLTPRMLKMLRALKKLGPYWITSDGTPTGNALVHRGLAKILEGKFTHGGSGGMAKLQITPEGEAKLKRP